MPFTKIKLEQCKRDIENGAEVDPNAFLDLVQQHMKVMQELEDLVDNVGGVSEVSDICTSDAQTLLDDWAKIQLRVNNKYSYGVETTSYIVEERDVYTLTGNHLEDLGQYVKNRDHYGALRYIERHKDKLVDLGEIPK